MVAESAPETTNESTQEVSENEVTTEAFEATAEESAEVQSETTEELQQEVEEAIEAGATEEEVKDMIKTFTLKVHGKEVEKTLDLSDEDAIKRELQMAEANKGGMQRAAELEKLYEEQLGKAKEDPYSFLKELGLDPDELAERRIQEKIEEMKKSPEELAREKMEKELKEARAQLRAQEEAAKNAEFEKMQQEEATKLNQEITQALDAHKTLPNTPKTVMRIADALLWASENGYENASVNDVLPAVEAEIRREMREFLNEMPEGMMEEYIGKQNLERLRKKRLSTMKTQPVNKVVQPTTNSVKREEKERKKVSAKDFFRSL